MSQEKIKVVARLPEPPPVYDITGLSLEDARALRDLLGHFSCRGATEGGPHWHTKLYAALVAAIGSRGSREAPCPVTSFHAGKTHTNNLQWIQCSE